MTAYSKVARGALVQPAWSGSMRDLESLVQQCEELASYVRSVSEPILKAALDARIVEIQQKNARWEDMRDEYNEIEIGQARSAHDKRLAKLARLEIRVSQDRWGLRLRGEPEDVLPDVTPEEVRGIDIELASDLYDRDYSLRVTLGPRGSTAEFSGPDTKWVDLARTRLDRELKSRLPRYWWLRGWQGSIVHVLVSFPAIAAASMLTPGWIFYLRLLVVLAVGLGVQFVSRAVAHKLTPTFELYQSPMPSGSRSESAARRLAAGVWSIVAAVVIPIVLIFVQVALTPR